MTELIYPDGMEILYSYDDLNRMTEIKRYVDGSNDEILLDNVQYTPESLLTQFDYGNDLRASFSYDARDRPLTMDVKDGETSYLDLDSTYDDNSNITQMVNGWRDTTSNWHSQTETYTYDGLDRLVSALSPSWSHTYAYDKVGNRVAKDGTTYTINVVNEVTALSDGTTFMYDSNGNRTQKTKELDTWVYTYDYADRLTRVEKNSATLGEYVYDGDGKRIQATENSTTYIYSRFRVLYEETATGTAAYIYGPSGKLAKRTTSNSESHTYFYHTDNLGSTRLVTDEDKNVVSAITYHPFGEIDVKEGSENYLFAGKKMDSTGLYYFGARYYDPEIGRFLTKDTWVGKITDPQSLNRYTYCYNNPRKYVDPWGNMAEAVVGGLALTASLGLIIACVVCAVVVVVAVVAYLLYKEYKENQYEKEVEMGRVEYPTKGTPLEKYGVGSVVMIDNETCMTRNIIVHSGEKGSKEYHTFFKSGGQWYHHPPGEPLNWIPCTEEEARYLESLVQDAEEKYRETTGCGGAKSPSSPPPTPPSSGGSEGENPPTEPNQAY